MVWLLRMLRGLTLRVLVGIAQPHFRIMTDETRVVDGERKIRTEAWYNVYRAIALGH